MTQLVSDKLRKVLGETKGDDLVRQLLVKLGRDQLRSPDDLKQMATELMDQGGVTQMIGRSLFVEAVLRGAGRQR
jgi:hypothetical protein